LECPVGDGVGRGDLECFVGLGVGEAGGVGVGVGVVVMGGMPAGPGDGPKSPGSGAVRFRWTGLLRECADDDGEELADVELPDPAATSPAVVFALAVAANVYLYSRAPPRIRTMSAADEATIASTRPRRAWGWTGKPSLSRLPSRRATKPR
jgi:hypothetical protein